MGWVVGFFIAMVALNVAFLSAIALSTFSVQAIVGTEWRFGEGLSAILMLVFGVGLSGLFAWVFVNRPAGVFQKAGVILLYIAVGTAGFMAFGFGIGGMMTAFETDQLVVFGVDLPTWLIPILGLVSALLGFSVAMSMVISLWRFRKRLALRALRPGFLNETLPVFCPECTPQTGMLSTLIQGGHLAIYADGMMLMTTQTAKDMRPNRYGEFMPHLFIRFADIAGIHVIESDVEAINRLLEEKSLGDAAFNATIGEVFGVRQSTNPIAARLVIETSGQNTGIWSFAIPAKLDSLDLEALSGHVKVKTGVKGEASNPLGDLAGEGVDALADAAGLPLAPGDIADALSFLGGTRINTDAARTFAELLKLRFFILIADYSRRQNAG
jgi:hypothetical protein